ncbi:hypothetical protein [Oceanobacillus senegalensis]|uniref:hypothetical protein n=1 Tax=Oceanobacillus senegalensis TaxID=1936063 RepID=UPI000A306953|nr:hypothetical protein [Oceanobacillus senegalensis]
MIGRKMDDILYIPSQTQKELFVILDEIFEFGTHYYRKKMVQQVEKMILKMDLGDREQENQTFSQLVYWVIFCCPFGIENITIYQHYLLRNKLKLRRKNSEIQLVLAKWRCLNPGFYLVIKSDSLRGQVLIVRDIFEGNPKCVCLFHKNRQVLKHGDLITGMMLPIGNHTYTALNGLIQVPSESANRITRNIIPYFEQEASSRDYQFNPHLYPSLLHITLQEMERIK